MSGCLQLQHISSRKGETSCTTLEEALKKIGLNASLYDVLGVSADATMSEIVDAYQTKSMEFIPKPDERLTDQEMDEKEENFFLVTAAFTILRDREKRKEYDNHSRLLMDRKRIKRNGWCVSEDESFGSSQICVRDPEEPDDISEVTSSDVYTTSKKTQKDKTTGCDGGIWSMLNMDDLCTFITDDMTCNR